MQQALVTLAVLVALVGRSPSAWSASAPQRVVFACAGGQTLVAEFVTADPLAPALVRPPTGPPLALPAQASGSGFRYADTAHELRGKGRDVTWTVGGASPLACTARD